MKTNLWVLERYAGPVDPQEAWNEAYRGARMGKTMMEIEAIIVKLHEIMIQKTWVQIMNPRPLDVAMQWAIRKRAEFTVRIRHTETNEVIMADIL